MKRASTVLLALSVLGLAAPAKAATVLGAPAPASGGGSASGSVVQTASTGGAYTVPANGVITSFWFATGTATGSMRALVFRPTGVANQYTVVARSDLGAVATPNTASPHFATRLPVHAGDLLGAKAQGPQITYTGSGSDTICSGSGAAGWTDPAAGAVLTSSSCNTPTRTNMAAALEPDADGDGYGDETQDACTTDASTHGTCPPPAATPTPPAAQNPVTPTAIAPTLTALAASKTRFRRGTSTTISFKLDNAARVSLTFLRRSPGRRSGRRCVAPTRANRRARACIRERAVGKLTIDGTAGPNRLKFTGRLSARRSLSAGTYRIAAVANAGGKLSRTRSVVVTILRAG
jgi:hypothetical protein